MRFDLLSLFPQYFESPFGVSMIRRGRERGLLEINLVDIRDFSSGRYRQVDDRLYGGGPGMVLMAEPVVRAIRSVRREGAHVVYLTPQGSPLTAKRCRALAQKPQLIIVCGHYEGVDQRAIDAEVDEEISIGDYVLTSGAPAAVVLVDSVSRFVPGVIDNLEATKEESFEGGRFEAPVYTRPAVFEGREVPEVLQQGNHAAIRAWREEQALNKTQRVRPDLGGTTFNHQER